MGDFNSHIDHNKDYIDDVYVKMNMPMPELMKTLKIEIENVLLRKQTVAAEVCE